MPGTRFLSLRELVLHCVMLGWSPSGTSAPWRLPQAASPAEVRGGVGGFFPPKGIFPPQTGRRYGLEKAPETCVSKHAVPLHPPSGRSLWLLPAGHSIFFPSSIFPLHDGRAPSCPSTGLISVPCPLFARSCFPTAPVALCASYPLRDSLVGAILATQGPQVVADADGWGKKVGNGGTAARPTGHGVATLGQICSAVDAGWGKCINTVVTGLEVGLAAAWGLQLWGAPWSWSFCQPPPKKSLSLQIWGELIIIIRLFWWELV